ncbi:unnamed protein product, partial [Adineta steineri]
DDNFYQLVEKIAGPGEAKLLEVQGIRSVYSFFNIEDVFNILSFTCSAIKEIKKLICLEDEDKNYMVKPGCRSNIRYLYQLLYQKHEEHLKEITPKSKRNKQSQLHQSNSTTMNLSQDSSQDTSILSNHQQSTTTPNLMNILNHHGVLIHMLNEWFERNFRTIYILNGNLIENEDYKLLIAFNGTSEEACITCFCGVKVRLTRVRENFSLSNYYKHLKTKSCVMMKKKKITSSPNNDSNIIDDDELIDDETPATISNINHIQPSASSITFDTVDNANKSSKRSTISPNKGSSKKQRKQT